LKQNAMDRFAEAVESLGGRLLSVKLIKVFFLAIAFIRVLQGKASLMKFKLGGVFYHYWRRKRWISQSI